MLSKRPGYNQKSLEDRLKDLQPKAPSLMPQELPGLVKQDYTLNMNCTEKQMEHVKKHLHMLRIKFDISKDPTL